MLANLLKVAGVTHVITIDLHASQMQGFFQCPIDNLVAEPTIAKWIRLNVPDWQKGVVVSKNPGGTKRVTSLADALKLSFGIVTTDRRRINPADFSVAGSVIFDKFAQGYEEHGFAEEDVSISVPGGLSSSVLDQTDGTADREDNGTRQPRQRQRAKSNLRRTNGHEYLQSPLAKSTLPDGSPSPSPSRLAHINTAPPGIGQHDDASEEFIDEVGHDPESVKHRS
jgi:ribose-phosphate pyrophosphokinase